MNKEEKDIKQRLFLFDLEGCGKCEAGEGWYATSLTDEIIKQQIISNNKKNIMSNILNKVKNLTLSKNDRLLREYDFQDNCGNFTQSARDVVIEKLVEDNKEYLIEVATKLKKEVEERLQGLKEI
jgi:hypothetical protein